jgi:hypothetical protein
MHLFKYSAEFLDGVAASNCIPTATSADPWVRDVLGAISFGAPVLGVGSQSRYLGPKQSGELSESAKPIDLLATLDKICGSYEVWRWVSSASKKFSFEGYVTDLGYIPNKYDFFS